MRRVVALFVGILSVIRATPFNLDSVDRPTPFLYNVEYGYDAFLEDSEYEIETFESRKNYIDESDKSGSRQGLVDLFGDLPDCKLMDLQKPTKEACVYVYNGSVYLLHALSEVNIVDVYNAFKYAGIEECVIGTPLSDLLKDHCYLIDQDNESVLWFGVNDEDIVDEASTGDDIKDIMSNIEKCDVTATEVPEEGCALLDENGLHFINVLTEDNIDDVAKALSEIGYRECNFDEYHVLIKSDPCYVFDELNYVIHLLNLPGLPQGVQDDDDYGYSGETYNIPDEVVSRPSLVQTATRNGNLQKMKLKGIFNKQSSVAKKATAFHAKKIQSRKQPQDVQKILGRRGHQHGRHVHIVNHRAK